MLAARASSSVATRPRPQHVMTKYWRNLIWRCVRNPPNRQIKFPTIFSGHTVVSCIAPNYTGIMDENTPSSQAARMSRTICPVNGRNEGTKWLIFQERHWRTRRVLQLGERLTKISRIFPSLDLHFNGKCYPSTSRCWCS